MEEYYKNLLKYIGEDTRRSGLKDTPKRAAKAFEYLTKGYKDNIDTIVNGAIFEADNDEMIIVKDIELYSLCEHHMLPFFGRCHVGYIPNGKILGLSKIARIVDVFARRLQVQENLTKQIADTILKYTNAKGNPKPYSDIDVVVVSPDLVKFSPLKRQEFLAKVTIPLNAPLEVLGYTPLEMTKAKDGIFAQIIREKSLVF